MSAVLKKINQLPADWKELAIEDIAEVNPRVNKSEIPDDLSVSFVPMPAVKAESGEIDISQDRPFMEVKKGFTPFIEGDVLFAKITPCMENGKMAVVPKVKNGYGFGSTEFHVLRAKEGMEAKYLYYFVSSRIFRHEAQHNMSGAVGQKRVPTNYLKQHLIPIAPPEQQKRIVAKIEELFSHIDAGIEALKKSKQLLKQYRQSVLKAAVTGELTKDLPCRQAGWRDSSFRNISDKRVPEKSNAYFTYVLECDDGSLYKGFSQDLYVRINRHLEGRGAKWTQEHKPVALIHFEEFSSEKEAVEREKYFKSGSGREWINDLRNQQKEKHETGQELLERILKERRQKWEEQQLEQFKTKGKTPKDDKWKKKYKDLSPVAEEEVESLPKLPDSWIYTKLGNVIDEPKYGTSKKCSYDAKGIGVLRIPNVAHGVIDSEDLKYAKFDNAEVETYKLNEGDILTIRSNGSINLVGKCALIDTKDTNYLYAGYLIRLRPNSKVVESPYLINVLNSIFLRNQIGSKAKSTSGVNNINSGELQSLVIPVCNKDEQAVVYALVDEKLESTDRLLSEIELQLTKAERNKQSILASVFLGQL